MAFFWKKSEIDKVKAKYGDVKGRQFLTYFYTYLSKSLELINTDKEAAAGVTQNIIAYILTKHGQAYLNEYTSFFNEGIKNQKLCGELAKTGTTYIDNTILLKKPTTSPGSESNPVKKAANLKGTVKTASSKSADSLGRDESKHLSCKYDGHESDCPDDCARCAISIKTDGDIALASNNLDEAVRLYKKAVFISPKFAEAWCNLGNAYGMKSEYNNALSAFNKAVDIDPKYGKALYGKAITLRNLGMLDEAMKVANAILDLYEDANVKKFKADLIAAGVKDRGLVIDSQKAKAALAGKAAEVLKANDLIEQDGSVEVIPNIFQPDTFTEKVLMYCKRKYASLGEKKVRGECIITSYYGSICAVVLSQRDPEGTHDCDIFDYLNNNIDIEFTDVNAERLLGTKAGEEKAEAIWELLSPYLSLTQAVFDAVDELSDDIMLEGMKHAYVLGMLVAKSYTSEKRKKHSLGTRAEIDRALQKLADSSKDYQEPPKESAMCYSIRVPEEVDIYFRCSKCGKQGTMKVYSGSENLMDKYRSLTKEFIALGHSAEVYCLCNDCADRHFPSGSRWSRNNIVFAFMAKDSSKPVYSFPSTWQYSDFKYKVALSFLKGASTIQELSEDTDSKLESKQYLDNVKEVIGTGR